MLSQYSLTNELLDDQNSFLDKCLENRLLLRVSATNVFKQLCDHYNFIDRLHRLDATISNIKQSISDWSVIIFKLSQFRLTINLVPALASLINGIENFCYDGIVCFWSAIVLPILFRAYSQGCLIM